MVAKCRGLPESVQLSSPTRLISQEPAMRAFIFPGQGSQAVGMGRALAEASADRPRGVRGSRRGAGPASLPADERRARRTSCSSPRMPSRRSWPTPSRRCACSRRKAASASPTRPTMSRAIRSANIARSVRRRRARPADHGVAAQASRQGDAGGGAGWRRCDGRAAWRRSRKGAGHRQCGGRGRSLHRRQRQ